MSIIDRILGRTPAEGPQIQAAARPPRVTEAQGGALASVAAPAAVNGERTVQVYDQFGRTLSIGREAWRRDVLLPNLAANRGDPQALFELIVSALGDGFAADLLDSARWLAHPGAQPRGGGALLGAVLLQLQDFSVARDVL